jgi:hypothetical protein
VPPVETAEVEENEEVEVILEGAEEELQDLTIF